MKKILLMLFIIGAILSVTPLYSQRISPLFQYTTSNSLLDRPVEFRDLQTSLDKDLYDIKPGLKLNYLYNQVSNARTKLFSQIKTPKVELEKTDAEKITIKWYLDSSDKKPIESLTLTVNTPTLKNIFDTIEVQTKQKFIEIVNSTLPKDKEIREAISYGVFQFVNTSDLEPYTKPILNSNDYSVLIAEKIASILVRSTRKEIEAQLRIYYPNLTSDDLVITILDTLKKRIDFVFTNTADKLRTRLSEAFDKAEDEAAKVINNYATTMIAANTGIAISDGD
ncbi:MAG: hypothetical protein V4642_03570, partial [Bacteroidota bacterium]